MRAAIGAVCVALLSLTACRRGPTRARTEAASASLEVVLEAPGMTPAELECAVVLPIERALAGVEGITHIVSEARAGRAAFVVGLRVDDGDDLDEVRREVHDRLEGTDLPASVEPPWVRRRRIGPSANETTTVAWSLGSDELGLEALLDLQAGLVREARALPDAVAIEDCRPEPVVYVEVDPAEMHAFGVDYRMVQVALAGQAALAGQSGFAGRTAHGAFGTGTIEDLTNVVVSMTGEGAPVSLRDFATVRAGLSKPPCVAQSARGRAVAAVVTFASAEGAAELGVRLDDAREGLPESVWLDEYGGDDASLHLVAGEGLELEQALETLVAPLAATADSGRSWLLVVGGEAPVCGESRRAGRLFARGADPIDPRPFEGVPEVAVRPDDADGSVRRLVLTGPELEILHELADARARQLAGSARAWLEGGVDPSPRVDVEPDPERLARLHVDASEVTRAVQLGLAPDGVPLSQITDPDGRRWSLHMRLAGHEPGDLDAFGELPVLSGGERYPLRSVATLTVGSEPTRRCRRDGRRAIVIAVWPDSPVDWAAIESMVSEGLPPGYAWAWIDGP